MIKATASCKKIVVKEKNSQSFDPFKTLRDEKNAVCLMSRRQG